jgi:aminomethyltransferase
MPKPTPFHARTSALCSSLFWKEWAGYHAVRSYDTSHETEYQAIRHAAALLDVTPLYKYEVRGADAAAFLAWVTVRDICKLKVGRVTYLCWCDDEGKVVDDGTVARLAENAFRVTAAEPALAWLRTHARGFDVEIEESTEQLGALALQGPFSRDILAAVTEGADIQALKFFAITHAHIHGTETWISRTGYTGDLGYEIWVPRERALQVWDVLIDAGRSYRLLPAGLDALDVARVEAGFIMNGVDYFSSNHCPIESRKSTPFELGLGWTVKLDRDPFVGQRALEQELKSGPRWGFVGLEIDWVEYERLFAEFGLPPQVPGAAWRAAVPVYDLRGRQVGRATSGAWSPILKRNLALASVRSEFGREGTRLRIEVTAEYQRRAIAATVRATPFYNPERKRAT